jgi:hypothetical protein
MPHISDNAITEARQKTTEIRCLADELADPSPPELSDGATSEGTHHGA